MISWMQKHRKYLVVTIWISTIAFVGVGTVGWGAYDFNKNTSTIAKVENQEISIQEVQQRYSNIVSAYKIEYGDKFTDKNAKEMGLDRRALNSVVEEYMLAQLSYDLGFMTYDDEVVEAILKNSSFYSNGKFDISKYENELKTAGFKKQAYESKLKQSLLISKLSKLFDVKASNDEAKNLSAEVQDNMELKVISIGDMHYTPNLEDIKNYWKANKSNFMSDELVKISTYIVKKQKSKISKTDIEKYYQTNKRSFLAPDGKIQSLKDVENKIHSTLLDLKTKKIANKAFYDFKNGKLKNIKNQLISRNNSPFSPKDTKLIFSKDVGTFLKPLSKDSSYILVKIDNKIPKTIKEFNSAKAEAKKELIKSKKSTMLADEARKIFKKFSGSRVGYISKKDNKSIVGLTSAQKIKFLDRLFASKVSNGYIMLKDKVVLYRILDQKLSYNSIDNSFANGFKKEQLYRDILKYISNNYNIKVY
jgi:peptidyl-prolyl cis-trans isomerase D